MKVTRVATGRVRGKRRTRGPLRYLPGGWARTTLPVYAYAVEHPGGVCLFDTGQTARATRPRYHPWWHPYLRLARFELEEGDEAGAQIDPHTVRWVVISHLHTDHVGGLAPFADAEVLVSRSEWERASGMAGRLRGYLPHHWPGDLEPQLVDFTGPAIGPFPASHDIAGDGALVLVPTPGHTPGHLSMIVSGECFLGGDLAHTVAGLDEAAPDIAAWCRDQHLTVLLTHDHG